MKTWGELLDDVAAVPARRQRVDALIVSAREVAAQPIVRRVYRYEDVGKKHRTWLDGRAVPLEPEIQETFALAMSDFGTANTVAREMPLLAAAYRLTRDESLLLRLTEQLEEVATWSPIQRPGWTCYHRGGRLPADGKDGNWLATGSGVRAIGDTLEILPEGAIGAPLRAKLDALLETEIAGVVEDWRVKRPWFVRSENPITNQWVLPTEGLVRACLILGIERHRDAYELGVANLMRALSAHGEAGEFEEGIGYASFTVVSMVCAARAMAVVGDRRALDHPFLMNFPGWAVQHLQPGRSAINCFDAGGASPAPRHGGQFRQLFSCLAAFTGSPTAQWALRDQFDGPSDDLVGLLAAALPDAAPGAAPRAYASYERAMRVNWRSSWADDAAGVWVRGGHPLDQHDHSDRGHVNYIAAGVPILIEAGTPSYDHPEMERLFSSGVGHNVLQLGTEMPDTPLRGTHLPTPAGWQLERPAPMTVHALDAAGGRVAVEPTACYAGLRCWHRTVAWSAARLTVTDQVELADGGSRVVLFRWHLGTAAEAAIEGSDKGFTAAWADARLTVETTEPVEVSQVELPDCTLGGRPAGGPPHNTHTCLVVRSRDAVNAISLTTCVTPTRVGSSLNGATQ